MNCEFGKPSHHVVVNSSILGHLSLCADDKYFVSLVFLIEFCGYSGFNDVTVSLNCDRSKSASHSLFCQRRNKLGIICSPDMQLSALFYSRSTLFMVFAVSLLLARADSFVHVDFHRHGKVASRSTLPLLSLVQSYTPKFSFL